MNILKKRGKPFLLYRSKSWCIYHNLPAIYFRKHRLFKNDSELVLNYEDYLVAVQLCLADINKKVSVDKCNTSTSIFQRRNCMWPFSSSLWPSNVASLAAKLEYDSMYCAILCFYDFRVPKVWQMKTPERWRALPRRILVSILAP